MAEVYCADGTLSVPLDRAHAAMVDGEELRAPLDAREERGLRPGHEGLASQFFEDREERRAAAGVEMRGDLVEQQDRRRARQFSDQARVGKHEPCQERLLLARGTEIGRHVLRPVPHQEVWTPEEIAAAVDGELVLESPPHDRWTL